MEQIFISDFHLSILNNTLEFAKYWLLHFTLKFVNCSKILREGFRYLNHIPWLWNLPIDYILQASETLCSFSSTLQINGIVGTMCYRLQKACVQIQTPCFNKMRSWASHLNTKWLAYTKSGGSTVPTAKVPDIVSGVSTAHGFYQIGFLCRVSVTIIIISNLRLQITIIISLGFNTHWVKFFLATGAWLENYNLHISWYLACLKHSLNPWSSFLPLNRNDRRKEQMKSPFVLFPNKSFL